MQRTKGNGLKVGRYYERTQSHLVRFCYVQNMKKKQWSGVKHFFRFQGSIYIINACCLWLLRLFSVLLWFSSWKQILDSVLGWGRMRIILNVIENYPS